MKSGHRGFHKMTLYRKCNEAVDYNFHEMAGAIRLHLSDERYNLQETKLNRNPFAPSKYLKDGISRNNSNKSIL